MLALMRRENEAVYIGESISVVVLAIDGQQVKLGFNAPNHVGIMRDELGCPNEDIRWIRKRKEERKCKNRENKPNFSNDNGGNR